MSFNLMILIFGQEFVQFHQPVVYWLMRSPETLGHFGRRLYEEMRVIVKGLHKLMYV